MKNFKAQIRNYSLITTIVIIAIVVVINILAVQIFYRFDLTQNKDYSLSDASKEVLKNLDDNLTINVYFSEKLPSEYLSMRQGVEDLLSEYQNYSQGKVKINYIDPKDDADLKEEIIAKGIPELQFNVLEKDQFQLTNGFLGIAVDYLDKEEILPVVETTNNFEYKLTSAVKKVSSKNELKIAWSKSSTESTQTYKSVLEELRTDYNVTEVDLTAGKLLDSSYQILVVTNPEKELDDSGRYIIDQFLMSGKSVFFLLDGIKVDKYLQTQENKTGLSGLLENYGLKLSNKLILDTSSEMATFSGGYMNFMVQYPYWVKATKDNFSQDNPAVSQLESITLPWASNIEINQEKVGSNQIQYLIKSSVKSWQASEPISLDPQQKFSANSYGQYNLAIGEFGHFESFFKDLENPLADKSAEKITSTNSGRLVLVGDADFISDSFIAQYPSNYVFTANMLDWLSQNETLIAIRSKGVTDRPLKQLSDTQKSIIKYANIFGITGIILIVGLIRFILRKRKIRFKL
jgi:gliding-associated putative ABC transporter substrate-binding component GldG